LGRALKLSPPPNWHGKRPPFREWVEDRLTRFVQKKLFNEERDPRGEDEEREMDDALDGIIKRFWILTYKPHEKQQLFHDSRVAQIRCSFSRNQGGKTTAGEAEVLSWGFGEDLWTGKPIEKVGKTKWYPGMRFFIGANGYTSAHNETILPKMEELLPLKEIGVEFVKMQGRITHKLIFPEPYSFSIKLISYDQEDGKQEGPTWNGGWFDEPPPKATWEACRRGCMKHAAPVLITATPLREPWMYDDLYRNPKAVHIEDRKDLKRLKWDSIAVVKIGRNDNPHISEDQMAAYEATLDEEDRRSRIYGEFRHLEGRVYKGFDSSKHVYDRDRWFEENPKWRTYPAFCIVDPHDRKPWAFLWGVITPRDQLVAIHEWPDFDFAKQKQWTYSIDEYADLIRSTETNLWREPKHDAVGHIPGAEVTPNMVWRVMDPNFGRTQKAGTGVTTEDGLADRGFAFDTNVSDNIESGHMAVKESLYNGRLLVLSNCKNSVKAFENYTWDDYRGKSDRTAREKPKDKFKDFADLFRYAEMSDMHFFDNSVARTSRQEWFNNGLE